MPKNSINQVQTAADNRRGQSGTWGGAHTNNLTLGLQLAFNANGPRDGMNTVSLALMTLPGGSTAWYASQDGNAVARPAALPLGWAWVNALNNASPVGLHAEMALIRKLYVAGHLAKGNEAANATAIDLVIVCCNANVCADCSGWMHSHGVPHCPALASPKTSAKWVHPRTGAYFSGGKSINAYSKNTATGLLALGGLPTGNGGAISHL